MANILTIGQSALVAAQAGISTAGQNIANAATPGYSRQSVVQSAVTPEPLAFGYLGSGVQIDQIQRVYNNFLGAQKVSAQSTSSQLQIQYDQIQQLNNMLADPNAGLSPVMQDFFNKLQDVSLAPGDAPSREAFMSSSAALISRFHDFQTQLDAVNKGVNLQISSSIQNVNDAAQRLADLNQTIAKAEGAANGNPPNDLLDKRDQLIVDLSKQVKVNVTQQDGQFNVYIGNGQPLVVGVSVHTLKAMPSSTDPNRLDIAYDTGTTSTVMSADNLAGGVLGGLLEFRSQTLDTVQNSLGRIALRFADTMNQQNQAGYTIDGNKGDNVFNLPQLAVNPSTNNSGDSKLDVTLSDSSKLTISDYRLQKNNDNTYSLIQVSNNTLLKKGGINEVKLVALDQGFNINTTTINMQAGDQFLIKPTANVVELMSLNLTNVNQLAAAGEKPASSGDNSNILKMIKFQADKSLVGANGVKISFQDAYAQMVNQVGSKTRELELTSTSANSILSQADKAIQDVSGVNLDEEAARLLRYQQAYQAAGKVIQISKQMFDSLLQISQ